MIILLPINRFQTTIKGNNSTIKANNSYLNVNQTPVNTIKIDNFLSKYGYKNVSEILQPMISNSTNYLIFGCNEVLYPEFPIKNFSNSSYFQTLGYYIDKNSICQIDNTSYNCTQVINNIYNLSIEKMNLTRLALFFDEQKNITLNLYEQALNYSINHTIPSFMMDPLIYDTKLLNSTANTTSAMLLALIRFKQVPYVINNSIIPYAGLTDDFTDPYEFMYVNLPKCSESTVFNFIVNENESESSEYEGIMDMKNVNITNICVINQNNRCNESEMKLTNSSFYVQG